MTGLLICAAAVAMLGSFQLFLAGFFKHQRNEPVWALAPYGLALIAVAALLAAELGAKPL
mgnify:CR=1 FL=1